MKRVLMIAAVLVLASSSAFAAATPPYKLDAKGKCHGSNGQFAKQSLCSKPAPTVTTSTTSTSTTTTTAKQCKNQKGQFVSCATPKCVVAGQKGACHV